MTSSSHRKLIWLVASFGMLIGGLYLVRLVASASGDPSVLLRIGEGSPGIAEYAETLLGRPVVRAPQLGHDGRFFFVQAIDPWITDPTTYENLLDRPRYRAGRVLYPMVAGGFGLFSPWQVVWGLGLANVAALGAGTFATALLAKTYGLTPWAGLVFALNPGMLFELLISGAGALAWAFGVGAIVMISANRIGVAGWLLAAAVLTREVMLLEALGLSAWYLISRRRLPVALITPPFIMAAVWSIWVVIAVRPVGGTAGEIIGRPFAGLIAAFRGWIVEEPLGLFAGAALLAVGLFVLVIAITEKDPLAWGTAGFALLAPFLTQPVWQRPFDITRALAPLFTAGILLLLARIQRPRPLNELKA